MLKRDREPLDVSAGASSFSAGCDSLAQDTPSSMYSPAAPTILSKFGQQSPGVLAVQSRESGQQGNVHGNRLEGRRRPQQSCQRGRRTCDTFVTWLGGEPEFR